MAFVVDASVVGSWVLPDENHPEALTALERLKDNEAFAPSLLWFGELGKGGGRKLPSGGEPLPDLRGGQRM